MAELTPTEVAIQAVRADERSRQEAALRRIKTSIDMHPSGAGRFIGRIVLDCECGKWGTTVTLADWSNLASVTESARTHLGECDTNSGSSS